MDLLFRVQQVDKAMVSAEAQNDAIQRVLQEETSKVKGTGPTSLGKSPDKSKRPKSIPKIARPSPPNPTAKGLTAAVKSHEHMKSIPAHTPLSTVLSQFKEAEEAWAHEKARLRREAVTERKRANKAELEASKQCRLSEQLQLDIKALKTALKNRDSQLEVAAHRIRELEGALKQSQEQSTVAIAGLNAERDDLKALLLQTLQRLEAVDHVVQRADMSSAIMEEKMHALEGERIKALEAAARARTEVNELTESRRKLQWQSKLLEKMSEVQLKHNKRKSEAIRKLLHTDDQPAGRGNYGGLLDGSELGDD